MIAKYLVIGGSAGAIGAVEAIREVDPVGTIALVSEESLPAYSRPMIGDYLSGDASSERIMYRPDDFWRLKKIGAFVGRRVVSIDLTNKSIQLDQDEKIGYEKLLIATGSKPVLPSISGVTKKGVFTFTTLADAEAVIARLEEAESAIVIGGGLIGVCVAEALAKRDVNVTIIELRKMLLSLLLDSVSSDIVEKMIQEKGVKVVTGHAVKRIIGRQDDDSEVGAVVLDNDEVISCDIVVMAIGVKPSTDLVLGTQIQTNRGIVVDRFMRTSVPNVYACGDVAEAYDFILDENRLLPQWPVAYLGGRVAGYNMAGEKVLYPGGTIMSALKYFDIPAIAAGLTDPRNSDGYQVLVSHHPPSVSYKKIVLKDGKIRGFILVSDIEKAGILFYLMQQGVNVAEFTEKLQSEDFNLITLPEQVRRTIGVESITR